MVVTVMESKGDLLEVMHVGEKGIPKDYIKDLQQNVVDNQEQ